MIKKVLFKIALGIVIIVGLFVILYNFNNSFHLQMLTFYYQLTPEKSSYQSDISICNSNGKVKDYFSKGFLTVNFQNGITDLYSDSCDGSNLKEYTCELNKLKVEDYLCEVGCFDGACLTPSEEPEIINKTLASSCRNYRVTAPLNAIAQSEYSHYSALNAIDGDLNTHWFGDPAAIFPKWIYFDFGQQSCISEIDLYTFSQDIPITGDLQASQDSVRWAKVLQNITLTNLTTTFVLPEVITARYIRFIENSSNRTYGELTDARFKIADIP